MECRDLVIDGLSRVQDNLRLCLHGMSAEQLAFRPEEQSNSMGWLAWHLTRVQDDHISDLAGRTQAWVAEGWHAKFGMPPDPRHTGFGHSAEQVAAFPLTSADLLLAYYEAVHHHSLEYLRGVAATDLDRVLDEPRWTPRPTVGVRLVSVLADCLQHVGQMDYVRGLIEHRHWYPA